MCNCQDKAVQQFFVSSYPQQLTGLHLLRGSLQTLQSLIKM